MYLGHNPGSAYGIFAMLALVLGLAVTGIMLGQGIESVEDLHEILAYVMLAAVGAHVLGVAAALFLLVIGRFLGALIANFDRTTSTTTLPILGTQLRLAETEGEKGENRGLSAVCHGPARRSRTHAPFADAKNRARFPSPTHLVLQCAHAQHGLPI